MVRVSFNLKKPTSRAKTLIYLVCRINGRKIKKSIKISVYPKEFELRKENKYYQRIKPQVKNSFQINNLLNKYKEEVELYYLDNSNNKNIVNLLSNFLNNYFENQSNDGNTVIEVFDQFINAMKFERETSTITKYNTTLTHLKNFEKKTKTTLLFENIDFNFKDLFHKYLVSINQQQNTVAKNFTVFNTFMKWSKERGMHDNSAFNNFKVKEVEPFRFVLSMEELNKIEGVKVVGKLKYVKDLFFFQVYTGLRYSEMELFKRNCIINDSIIIRVKKSKRAIKTVLLPRVKEILTEYNFALPIKKNQNYNEDLKLLAKQAGLNELIDVPTGHQKGKNVPKYKLLSSHVARRCFITVAIENGINSHFVSQVVGHKNFRTTQKYIQLSDKKIDQEFKDKFPQKFSIGE